MTSDEHETPLGGAVTDAVRVGDTVRRPSGPGTPAVVDLLEHLESRGFEGAPRVLGFDEAGRLTLTWVEGETGDADAVGLVGLGEVGALLRRYHDAVSDHEPSAAFEEGPRGRGPGLVVCHGDIAPRNTVLRGGRPVAFVDWDGALLADPLWDLAHAVWQFAPIQPDSAPYDLAARLRRARALVDGYGPSAHQRSLLPAWVGRVIRSCRRGVEHKAAAGGAPFVALVERGLLDRLDREARHADEVAPALATTLEELGGASGRDQGL